MLAVYKKELQSFFNNMTGYIFMAFLLLLTGIFTYAVNLRQMSAQFEGVLSNVSFIFLLITPMLTMRVISEERRTKTDQLLYSLPLGTAKVVSAKYLAMLTVFGIAVLIMGLYPILMSFYGNFALRSAYACLLGFFCLGGSLIAIGLFMSALTESQIIAAVSSFGVLLVIYLMGSLANLVPPDAFASFIGFTALILVLAGIVYLMLKNVIIAGIAAVVLEGVLAIVYRMNSALFEGAFSKVLSSLSLFDRFYNFLNGVFDLTSLVYFISVAALFVFLTVQAVEKRRWS
ncbi:MAG: ABC transporter [Ruminococcaceae bacterium]|nr:ABC transporter [Oscillospiraceae bacterium]